MSHWDQKGSNMTGEDMPMMQKFWFIFVVLVIVTKQTWYKRTPPSQTPKVPKVWNRSCQVGVAAPCAMCVDLAYGSGGAMGSLQLDGVSRFRDPVKIISCQPQKAVILVRILNHGNKVVFVWLYYFWMSMAPYKWCLLREFPYVTYCPFNHCLFQIVEIQELGQVQRLLRCARSLVGPAASLQLHRLPVANSPLVATSSCTQATSDAGM